MYVHTLLSPYTYLSFSFYLEISSLESKGCDVSHWYVNHQLRHYDHPCCHSVVFHSDPALRQIWSHRHHQHRHIPAVHHVRHHGVAKHHGTGEVPREHLRMPRRCSRGGCVRWARFPYYVPSV